MTEATRILIEYDARPWPGPGGEVTPMIWVQGRYLLLPRVVDEDPLQTAELEARHQAARWVGDWDIVVRRMEEPTELEARHQAVDVRRWEEP